ncbi:MAG: hypothetical protein JJU02_09065, partial [Cryomorphaceae bacterium]|nr:hypothetical protein [Cryomorphaceae bacterium]
MKISTFLISCVLTVLVFQISAQNRIYVSPNGNGLANGSSWNNALPGNQIQSAIDGLTSGGEVWIAAGTYLPTQTYDNSADVRRRAFTLRANVHVFGGFAGNETDTAQRTDFGEGGANETILSGDIGIPGDSTDNSYHVIWALAAADNTRLDGLTIRDGVANGNIINDRSGGGMHLSGKTILFKCVIKNNYAETNGGGGFVRSNNELHYCTIKENHADGLAGGIYFIHFNLSSNVEPIANHCLFFKNSTPSEGGGAHLRGGGQVYNSQFIGNLAQRGGAAYIHNQGAIVNCIAANNRATITGGGFHITAGNIINSTIVRNQSGGTNGGGVYRSGNTGVVQNCVIWGNNNQFRYLGSNVAVENTAMQSGFNVPAGGQGPGIITLSNQNSGNDPGTLYPHFVNPSSVIGNNPTNPEILLDFDWNITCESALIDMGATSHIPSHITTDFHSNNRFTDGNGNGDSLPDLGAFEDSKHLQTTVTIFPVDTVLLGNQIINTPGVYTDTLSGIGSCDSILQLTVIALPTDSGFVNAQICEGDVFTYRGQAFSTPGKHYLTAPSSGDCDSIIEIN